MVAKFQIVALCEHCGDGDDKYSEPLFADKVGGLTYEELMKALRSKTIKAYLSGQKKCTMCNSRDITVLVRKIRGGSLE